ncbi:MAG TPA: plastocyanin/azurin family copper-binding protein [Gemmatimonadales bacterium]|nr:plastocyanin/azurin family copper-binding protein [Gemmatimonadales bacterium]
MTLAAALGCNSVTGGYGGGGGGGANCSGSGAAATVNALDALAFSPDSVTITHGQSVCWQNVQTIAHTVQSDTGSALSHPLSPGVIYQHTFAAAGRFPYHCAIHGTGMHGVVIVN